MFFIALYGTPMTYNANICVIGLYNWPMLLKFLLHSINSYVINLSNTSQVIIFYSVIGIGYFTGKLCHGFAYEISDAPYSKSYI